MYDNIVKLRVTLYNNEIGNLEKTLYDLYNKKYLKSEEKKVEEGKTSNSNKYSSVYSKYLFKPPYIHKKTPQTIDHWYKPYNKDDSTSFELLGLPEDRDEKVTNIYKMFCDLWLHAKYLKKNEK